MTPEIGEVYDIPGQKELIEIMAIDKVTESDYFLVVLRINKQYHFDTKPDELKISKQDFDKALKVEL